jgi:hypothetical protein
MLCVLSFHKEKFQKTPYIYKYNKGNPTIGEQRWVLPLPPKIEIGRVCEECRKRNEQALEVQARNSESCYFHKLFLVEFPVLFFNISWRR